MPDACRFSMALITGLLVLCGIQCNGASLYILLYSLRPARVIGCNYQFFCLQARMTAI